MSIPGIVVAARVGSTRLPGKALKDFRGSTVLGSCLARCLSSGLDVILAVPDTEENMLLRPFEEGGVGFYQGPEDDVLTRVTEAAHFNGFDPVIRVTGDCPLTEPGLILAALALWFEKRRMADPDVPVMVSNVWPTRTFAKGLDVEVIERVALLNLANDSYTSVEAREHVTRNLYGNANFFATKATRLDGPPSISIFQLVNNGWWPTADSEPLCVDTPEDLARLNRGPR